MKVAAPGGAMLMMKPGPHSSMPDQPANLRLSSVTAEFEPSPRILAMEK
jgi:hypothetical protein